MTTLNQPKYHTNYLYRGYRISRAEGEALYTVLDRDGNFWNEFSCARAARWFIDKKEDE